jgi:hypothetical protein
MPATYPDAVIEQVRKYAAGDAVSSMALILRGIAARPSATGDNLLSARDCRELREAADLIEQLRTALESEKRDTES